MAATANAIHWTPEMTAKLGSMSAAGITRPEIAAALGFSVGAIANQLERVRRKDPGFGKPHARAAMATNFWQGRESEPLKAGHPMSWGLISAQPWPGGVTA